MDYYKNADKLSQETKALPPLQGLQYSEVPQAPAPTEPVDTAFFKSHARIDFDTDDTLVAAYLKAARAYLENWAQKSFRDRRMQLTAIRIPENFRLAYGPVLAVQTAGFTAVGDILIEGGENVEIQYTTNGIKDDVVRIAICRYATGLYMHRENILDSKLDASAEMDQAKAMLMPYKFVTLF